MYLYFVCIIMGVEYAINIGERILDQYKDWLIKNEGKSPLLDEIQAKKTATTTE
jgi:oligoribonuclease (3'-5' exoribonuclease)